MVLALNLIVPRHSVLTCTAGLAVAEEEASLELKASFEFGASFALPVFLSLWADSFSLSACRRRALCGTILATILHLRSHRREAMSTGVTPR